ncbi:RNA dependent RNA polymerase-domain-containing protein [Chaetomidium leptoderma]|uniref:RNA-directed RNA polymerase n=1 Tax=Chaetomidium leptoderma TaxID=669021 RepID=A0AAN6ZRM5_9PEZI|nr:RNA dependent RNA polymerase-domain-containing protein [Chaetomidium leptoderma]
MADPGGGNFQHLLLENADNGRLKVQAAFRPPPGNRGPHWRSGERPPFGRTFGPATRQTRQPASGLNTSLGPRPSLALQTAAVLPPRWSSRKSATMIIKPIPIDATPWDIRQVFEKFGKVVWVELDNASRGGFRSAKVRFEPPPTDVSFFYQGKCRLDIGRSVSWPSVEFPRQSAEEPTLTTPLGNTCPALMAFKPEELTFGLLTQPTTFMRKREVLKLGGDLELKFTADFRRKKLIIHFPLLVQGERHYYRIDMKFGIIRNIYRTTIGDGQSALVICLEDAPLVRKKQTDVDGDTWADRLVWGEDELWNRAVEIKPGSQNPKAKPVSLDEKANIIDLGRWTAYWLGLDAPGEELWSAIEARLRDWNIATKTDVDFAQIPDKSPELWNMLADPHSDAMTGTNSPWNNGLALLSATSHISLPYDVRYQLEVCISRGILCEYNLGREFLEKLVEIANPSGLDSNRARLVLEYAADQGKPIYEPMELFKSRSAMTYYPTTLHIPEYCALVRKVTVTPTRIYFSTPTVETTNRIVRRYKNVQDHFIRVQFTDELLDGRIRACEVERDDELYTRVYRVMTQGIRMGKWHWKFLAFGNSQIRESGAFFFCEPEDHYITCDTIRQWMGNFSHISTVAKLAARLGQCFSTTRLLHCISSPRIVKIPDVEKHGFCFTDGVGKISTPLACLVSEDWKIYPPPSAFQFRMGGCKGVLVTWPDAKGTEVHVRPSQEKFSAEYNGLEIIRCSQFACATLNRQTILILSCLGVPDEVFTDMMAAQISNYDTAMTDNDKAVELLSSYVDENMTSTTIATMVLDGFMHTREPFVRTLLQLWRSWSIKALKEKARLIVDKGAFVLGCVDETGTLRGHSKATEGRKKISQDQLLQIFLQVPDPKDRGAYKVITGLCLVGRNPSLHPGDIRVVEAVDVPRLRHLRDVVVFPLNGDRDVPGMCSGGDLDGDDFFVIWDPKLLPSEWSHPPMDYTAPKPLTEPRASTARSLASFFVLFMKNDRLPLIAHAHLATADYEVEGAKHRKCLQLAELHSTAVDYVKTGVPAEWNKKLDPRRYPHFMEKAKGKSYQSTSVLGKLYDMIDKEVFDNRENYMLPFDDRVLKRYQLDIALLKEARKIKTQYDIAMRRVMGQLEIRTEFEIWTTFVLSRPRVGTDYKVQEKVGRESAGLKKQFRDLCIKAIEEKDLNKLEFVAAMYTVTWEETRIALYEARQPHVLPDGTVGLRRVTARSMPLISFPWLFSAELGRIAIGTERLPNWLREAGSRPPSAKPKAKDGIKTARPLETALDLAGMDYTRTSDGQFIHRGEILHLFRHDDDGEVGFYCNGDVADPSSPADSDSNKASTGGHTPNSPTTEKSPDPFPDLLGLATALDRKGSISAATFPASIQKPSPSQLTVNVPDIREFLAPDTDAASSDFVHYITPTNVPTKQQQQGTPIHTATTTTSGIQSIDGGSEASVAVLEEKEKGDETGGGIKPDTESTISESNSSWDRVTTPGGLESSSSSSAAAAVAVELGPVEYISLSRSGVGARFGGGGGGSSRQWGYITTTATSLGSGQGQGQSQACPGTAVAADAEDGESGGSDGEVEYEEVIIEVEAETALERAVRLAA